MASTPPSLETRLSIRFLIRAALVGVVACVVGGMALHGVLARDLGPEFRTAHYALKHTLALVVPALLFCAVSVLFVGATGLLVVAIFASHKVAGPLFRLQRVAGYLEKGILGGTVHLREKDQLRPFVDFLNTWVDARKYILEQEVAAVSRAKSGVERFVEAVASGNTELAGKVLSEVRSVCIRKKRVAGA